MSINCTRLKILNYCKQLQSKFIVSNPYLKSSVGSAGFGIKEFVLADVI
jgi:hypothetical protein